MKHTFFISLLLVLVTASPVCAASPISDPSNPHNLSSLSSGSLRALPASSGGTDEICVFCHTPHAAAPKTPLWNRPDPSKMGSFPVYGSPLGINQDAAAVALTGYDASNPEYPSGSSRMCLSCHDGTTSVGILLGNQTVAMEGGVTTLSDSIDLATSHPISFNYNDNVVNLIDPTRTSYQLPPDGDGIDTPLDGAGQMQCTTCHDPHSDTRAYTGSENLPFWRNTVVRGTSLYDDVCNSCHIGTTPATPPHSP
jgi:hypothetical protein